MPQAKRYYVIEHQGVPVEVTSSWARANELQKQYSSKKGAAVVVEVESLQQELPIEPEACLNDNYEVGSGRLCYCSRGPNGH